LSYSVLLALAVATSIDALIVGISFAFLKSSILEPAIIIGSVTFFMSLFGAYLGVKWVTFSSTKPNLLVVLYSLGLESAYCS